MTCKYSMTRSFETDDESQNWTKIFKCKEKATHEVKINKKKLVAKLVAGDHFCQKHAARKVKEYNEAVQYRRKIALR